MRAARLLDMLLLLQRRGRVTAHELSVALEVSERTILRDVDALSEAGVAIFTVQGTGGGIELVDGFRTHLDGLTSDEARCLFLVGQPQLAQRLGFAAPTRTVRNKLLNAITPALADHADELSSWFVNDPDPWTGNRIPHGELRRLARAIGNRRRVEVTLGRRPARTVEPLGLVLKAGSWFLVVADTDSIEVLCVDDLRATRLTNRRFNQLDAFDLTTFWTGYLSASGAAPPGGASASPIAVRLAGARAAGGSVRKLVTTSRILGSERLSSLGPST